MNANGKKLILTTYGRFMERVWSQTLFYIYVSLHYFIVKKIQIIRINKYTGVPKKKMLKKHP